METTINLLHPDQQAIVAQCTPIGSGAIALIRLSGKNAIQIAHACAKISGPETLINKPSHTILYGSIIDVNSNAIDQVLFLLMRAPKTFTGDDTVEITCHNNQFIVQAIIDTLLRHGARMAQPGEFTRRAVFNNKIDVTQAEAINELIHANSQQALKSSLSQLQGSLSAWITNIESQLITCIALAEASFEFIDEEDLTFGDQIAHIITTILDQIVLYKDRSQELMHVREGVRIALIGSVNAGKSALFNTLLAKDRAIVSSTAGTTRDSIEAGIYQSGMYWTLIDTAGLRQTEDSIEQQGIERSFDEAGRADVILLVCEQARPLSDEELEIYHTIQKQYSYKVIGVWTKNDQKEEAYQDAQEVFLETIGSVVETSSTLQTNIDVLYRVIQTKINKLFKQTDTPFLLNQRHFYILTNLQNQLQQVQSMLQGTIEYELISYHLNDALACIKEMTGKSISEEAMDAVFRNFCVGK